MCMSVCGCPWRPEALGHLGTGVRASLELLDVDAGHMLLTIDPNLYIITPNLNFSTLTCAFIRLTSKDSVV